jgi:mRNA-degrading endonuclease RelE of RelBE toxin-antitoxin system
VNCEKMRGHRDAYRIRVDGYRIGIYLVEKKVYIVTVQAREVIYQNFP